MMSIYEGFDPSQVPEPFGNRHDSKHTSSNLVERLRDSFEYDRTHYAPDPLVAEAADRIEALEAENERLRGALRAYTEYCNICHSRGSIIEEDEVTGADLWRDCPGCSKARAALEGTSHE